MIRDILVAPSFLTLWAVSVALSLAWLTHDLRTCNPEIKGLMRWVWFCTVAYSGPFGLAIYYYAGRAQMRRDTLGRRAFRSVAHCYSGCGAGEIVGVSITAGLLSLGTAWTTGLTFALAYVAGFTLTVGPLVQDGVPLRNALRDALYSETASITVMEVSAIGIGLWLGGGARIDEPLFWSSLVVSLTAGLVAAYPVNVALIALGLKEGMHSPRRRHQPP